ncbi:MAG: hypothetical protein EB127_03495 [Alphaproteobacteria bacterium]|nr:hypothetical protein [Alphaproteobacteria bacterium]
MTNNKDDSGESINPTEQNIGILNEDTLSTHLRGVLFSDEQDEGNSSPVENNDEEVQTEDKVEEGEVEQLDGVEENLETDPKAEDGENVLSQETEGESPEENLTGVQKRIDKLTALRKTAEERAETLQTELDALKSKVEELESKGTTVAPTPDNPFSDLETVDALKKEYEQARELRYQCEANPDGFSIGETYFDRDTVKTMKLNCMKAMELYIPKQLDFIRSRNQWKPVAMETYPWLKNKDSQEYKLYTQVLKNFPDFRKFPDYELFVGDYIRGYLARNASSLKKSATSKPVPSMSVKPTASSTQTGRNDAVTRSTQSRYAKTGSREDLKQIVSKFL